MTMYRLCSQIGRELHEEGLYERESATVRFCRMKDDCKALPAREDKFKGL